ncbi:MAG: recombinase [Treponema sp.]|nr:MAG: recombinase [Treponema sp.]
MQNNQKLNYNKHCNSLLQDIIEGYPQKSQDILLHACCAPCSSAVLFKLKDVFKITLFFYNPNIDTSGEYKKREQELKKLAVDMHRDYGATIDVIASPYTPEEFYCIAKGKETCPEGGRRCKDCYKLRIKRTADEANESGFKYFCSTLSLSPLKNAGLLNTIGFENQTQKALWLPSDFKKENGYLKSIELSKKYELYRQDYCGCSFSKPENM